MAKVIKKNQKIRYLRIVAPRGLWLRFDQWWTGRGHNTRSEGIREAMRQVTN